MKQTSINQSSGLNVLVTGGAGFIGSHTCDALIALGHNVRVLDNLDPQVHGDGGRPSWLHPAVELMNGDVRVREDLLRALEGIDAVYHLAAQTGVGQSMYEIHGYYDINVGGTAMLLDLLANHPNRVRRIILSSSRAVYGEGAYLCPVCGPEYPPPRSREALAGSKWEILCSRCGAELQPVATPEDKPFAPISFYAETKRCQEELLRIFNASYGIPCTILRYFNVYGTRQSLNNPYTGIASIFVTRALSGGHISIYEDGLQGRDFVNVRDVVRANILALGRQSSGVETFNIGSGERLTVLDLARNVCRELGVPEDFRYQGEFRVGDIRDCYADLTDSRNIFGYEPEVSFSSGVTGLVAWARGESRCDRLAEAEQELRSRQLM